MANLFNLDIDQIKHNGNEVLLMKLNGNIVYEKETFRIEYTVASVDRYLNESGHYGLPRIYSRYGEDIVDNPYSDEDDVGVYSYNYSKVEIVKKDGTVTSNLSTKCNEIAKVKLWYPETTEAIRFTFFDDTFGSAIREITYCNMSNFVSAKYMFYSCSWNLKSIKNVGKWRTKNLTDMSCMFSSGYSDFTQASNLVEINLSNINTTNATDMSSMFWNCDALITLDLSSFNTSNVTNMGHMFNGCNSLTELDLSNFDVSKVASMSCMFKDCTSLQSLDLSNFDVSQVAISEYGLEDMFGYMFENCTSLHTLRLDNCNNETLKRLINYGNMPRNYIDGVTKTIYCKKSQLSGVIRPGSWIYSYVYEEEPDVPDIPEEPDTSTVPYMEYTVADIYDSKMLGEKYYDKDTGADGCYGLPRVYTNASNYSYTGYDDIEIVLKDDTITNKPSYVSIAETSKVKLWFPENTYSIRFSPIYTTSSGSRESSRVNDLTYINYSGGVTDMSYMFQYCTYLTKCNFDCDTSNVTDMSGMFHSCQLLSSLDLSGFNTSNVTNMSGMFNSCSSLATLNLSGWNTNNVTRMDYMFQYCSSLTDLNLSSFDMSRTTNVYNMFYSCSNLTNLDAPRNISANIIFSSCKNLTHDSLMSIINNLATVTDKTLTLGATNLAKLSEEEKAIATNKGWTLK